MAPSVLRAATAKLGAGVWSGQELETLTIGQRVPVNPMTSYDALGKIIDKYNSLVTAPHQIDRDRLVRLRDTLAHGRPLARRQEDFPRLLKFGREEGGTVPVEAVIDMTDEWLVAQREFVLAAATIVGRRVGWLGPDEED